MKLNRRFINQSTADGTFRVQCAGARHIRLAWDAADGAMEEYLDFAYLPLDENGCAAFTLTGDRSVPPGATHIRLTAEFADGHTRTRRFPIPQSRRTQPISSGLRLCLMSDLHMTRKPFRLRNAIRMGSAYDAILFAGDITNDGTAEQFERVKQIIDGAQNVIFHSGHAHVTLNEMRGCVELDHERGNVYLNDGSICLTTFREHEVLEQEGWLAGAVAELNIAGDEIEISGRTIYGGKRFGRAYYRMKRR